VVLDGTGTTHPDTRQFHRLHPQLQMTVQAHAASLPTRMGIGSVRTKAILFYTIIEAANMPGRRTGRNHIARLVL
jgi:hypothetical protein